MERQYDRTARPERFQCPSCGHHRCERVVIRRAGKKAYVTEFVACRACRVMLWPAQEDLMRAPIAELWGDSWGATLALLPAGSG
jgi:transcription elongation factor Elf1